LPPFEEADRQLAGSGKRRAGLHYSAVRWRCCCCSPAITSAELSIVSAVGVSLQQLDPYREAPARLGRAQDRAPMQPAAHLYA